MSFIDRYLPAVLVDSIRRDIAISDVQFSTLQTAFALTYAATTLASGWLADRTHRLGLLLVGVTLWGIGALAFGLATDLTSLLTARILIGLGEAMLGPAGISLICDFLRPEQRGRAIALTYFGATVGTSLAFSGGGLMLERAQAGAFAGAPFIGGMADWRQVVLIFGIIGFAFLPLLGMFKEPQRRFDPKAEGGGGFAALWRLRGTLWFVLLAGASLALADFAYTTWQTALLTRTYKIGAGAAGQYLGLTALVAGTAGAWIGGLWSDRAHAARGAAGRAGVLGWCALGLVSSAVLLLVPFSWAAVGAFAIWQMFANIGYVICAVALQDLVTDRSRALAAALSVCLGIGVGLGFGPTSVALLNETIGRGGDALALSLLIVLATMGIATLALAVGLRARLMKTST
ncbi:MAG: MFS transporter [Caulobacterales bacterium]